MSDDQTELSEMVSDPRYAVLSVSNLISAAHQSALGPRKYAARDSHTKQLSYHFHFHHGYSAFPVPAVLS